MVTVLSQNSGKGYERGLTVCIDPFSFFFKAHKVIIWYVTREKDLFDSQIIACVL